jgi:hypothetical protein
MLINENCDECGEKFQHNDRIVFTQKVYHVGRVHTEATEKMLACHYKCPTIKNEPVFSMLVDGKWVQIPPAVGLPLITWNDPPKKENDEQRSTQTA